MPPAMRQVLDAVPDVLLVLNAQRQTVFANRALLDLLGLPGLDDAAGQRPGELLHCEHAFKTPQGCGTSRYCEACGAAWAILTSLHGQPDTHECRITQTHGDALDLRVSTTPLDINGERYTVFVIQDISDEKRRQALERVFFHDLLNTATVLIGYTDLLLDNPPQNRSAQYRDMIHEAAYQLVEEINAQRELSQAESGELPVRVSPVNTRHLIQRIRAFYMEHEIARDRQLVVAEDAEAVVFDNDPTLLERVLNNLVKNALEASQPGETVTLSSHQQGDGRVMFTVHNPGVMPREVQLQVFQRSFSTKGPGRGLGTYSVKLLSERYLGGTVTFTSTPGDGTNFTAVYPALD